MWTNVSTMNCAISGFVVGRSSDNERITMTLGDAIIYLDDESARKLLNDLRSVLQI